MRTSPEVDAALCAIMDSKLIIVIMLHIMAILRALFLCRQRPVCSFDCYAGRRSCYISYVSPVTLEQRIARMIRHLLRAVSPTKHKDQIPRHLVRHGYLIRRWGGWTHLVPDFIWRRTPLIGLEVQATIQT